MIGPLEISGNLAMLSDAESLESHIPDPPNNAIKPRNTSAASVSRRKSDAGLGWRQTREAEGKSWHPNIPYKISGGRTGKYITQFELTAFPMTSEENKSLNRVKTSVIVASAKKLAGFFQP